MFKMRWYYLHGEDAGMLAHETFHTNAMECYHIMMALRSVGIEQTLLPTVWKKIPGGFERISYAELFKIGGNS